MFKQKSMCQKQILSLVTLVTWDILSVFHNNDSTIHRYVPALTAGICHCSISLFQQSSTTYAQSSVTPHHSCSIRSSCGLQRS